MRRILAYLIFLLLLMPTWAWGATCFVSPTGDGTCTRASCSEVTAKTTIQAGINLCTVSGDIVEIDGGISGITYAESLSSLHDGVTYRGSQEAGHNGLVTVNATGLADHVITIDINGSVTLEYLKLAGADSGKYAIYAYNSTGSDRIITGNHLTIGDANTARLIYLAGVYQVKLNYPEITGGNYLNYSVYDAGTATLEINHGRLHDLYGPMVHNNNTAWSINYSKIYDNRPLYTSTGNCGVFVAKAGTLEIINNDVFGNAVYADTGNAVFLQPSGSTAAVTVTNNNFWSNRNSSSADYLFNNVPESGSSLVLTSNLFLRSPFVLDNTGAETGIVDDSKIVHGTYTDGGGNIGLATTDVQTLPRFRSARHPGILTIGIDDASHYAEFQTVATTLESKGMHGVWCVDTLNMDASKWAIANALVAKGHEIASHTRRHVNLDSTKQGAFTITYAGNVAIDNTTAKTLTTTGGTNDKTIDLSQSAYTAAGGVTALCSYIAGLSGYSCSLSTGSNTYAGNGSVLNLADVTSASAASGLALSYSSTRVYADEVVGSLADLKANIPAYASSNSITLVYPGSYNDSSARAAVIAAGFLGARGDNTQKWSLTNTSGVDISSLHCNQPYEIFRVSSVDYNKRRTSDLCETLNSYGGLAALYGHAAADIPADALDVIKNSNVSVMTTSQAIQWLKTNGTNTSGNYWNISKTIDNSDYHLQASSPAKDAGTNLCSTLTTATDLDGHQVCTGGAFTGKGTAPDIGAYEFSGGRACFRIGGKFRCF